MELLVALPPVLNRGPTYPPSPQGRKSFFVGFFCLDFFLDFGLWQILSFLLFFFACFPGDFPIVSCNFCEKTFSTWASILVGMNSVGLLASQLSKNGGLAAVPESQRWGRADGVPRHGAFARSVARTAVPGAGPPCKERSGSLGLNCLGGEFIFF